MTPQDIAPMEVTLKRLKLSSRLQFSLRTFLVVVLIGAIPSIYVARQDAARRQLITDIESNGGKVKFDESIQMSLFKSQRVTEVVIPHNCIADFGPMRLKLFPNLSTLGLSDFDYTNSHGARIQASEIKLPITDEPKGLESTKKTEK